MKTITIGFSKHKGFAPASWAIRKFCGTEFSHTYFKFQQEFLEEKTVFHAVGKGLTYISETNFLVHNEPTKEFELKIGDQDYAELLNKCHKSASIKYGYLQNLGIGFVSILQKLGIKYKRNPFNDGVNCSEWVCILLQSLYGDWAKKSNDLVSPNDVYQFLSQLK